uniref:Uncharacterized protein n=1 Tax=Eutreptiella gymnastica TaxID=73025 RepID=A0A7S4G591_9EUGL
MNAPKHPFLLSPLTQEATLGHHLATFVPSWSAMADLTMQQSAGVGGGLRSAIRRTFSPRICFSPVHLRACWFPLPLRTAVAEQKASCFPAPEIVEWFFPVPQM